MEEIWKDITGFEEYYQISTLGRVKSKSRKCNSRYGKYKTVADKILSLNEDKKTGYVSITFCIKNKRITKLIHRLVAETFIDNPENKHTVNHINGIKNDNNVNNLEWMTMSENAKHAYKENNKRIKKSWSREEVIKLLNDFGEHVAFEFFGINYSMIGELNKWIKENL